jgi:diacylglycerol kinase (ATP)
LAKRCVIFNPAARGDKARNLRAALARICGAATLLPTTGPGDATRLAAQAAAEGYEIVAAAGGDGTLNEAINGLAPSLLAGRPVRFAALPLGTANVLALEYGLPFDLAQAWDLVSRGQERRIDLAHATFQTPQGPRERYCLQLAGAGLDAHAVYLLNWRLKKRLGKAAYAIAMVQALLKSRGELTIQADGATHSARWALIGNGRYYAGKYRFFPRARPDDGLLDLCLFERIDPGLLWRSAWRLWRGGVLDFRGVTHLQSGAFTIRSNTANHLELDGEYAGNLPATFRTHPQLVRLIC